MPSRPQIMHAIIAQQRHAGITPMEIHANKATVDEFATEANLQPVVPEDTRSPMQRLLKSKEAPSPCLVFDGCRLVVNPRIVGPALLIRPSALMGDEEWLNKIQFHPGAKGPQGQQLIMPEGEETPWQQPAEQPIAGVAGSAQEEPEGTLAALTRAGGVTPTDVLMKAAEGMDRVEDVLVIRFHRGGDVDLCASMDRMKVMGALQMAMAYVARGE